MPEAEAGLVEALSAQIEWAERGTPRTRPPERRGFGRWLMERSVAYELGGNTRLDFAPEGVRCRIELPLG